MISIPGRIPVLIFPFFWFLILMIGWLNSMSLMGTVIWAAVILISILIHEYGHALTALMFGQRVEINLVGLGGVTKREGPKLAKWKEFLIVLNGPVAGLVTCAVAYFFLNYVVEKKAVLLYALEVAVEVNLFWTLLNLLPVLPLDGGQLVRIILESVFGLRGLKVAFFMSIILAGLLGLYFFLIQQIFMGAIFFLLAFESYRAWEDIKTITPQDEDEHLQDTMKEGIEELKRGLAQEALAKFSYIRQQAPKGMLYVNATQYAARILAEQGNFKQAYEWLYPVKSRISIDYLHLLQQLAYRVQEWEDAIKIGELAYQQDPSFDTALINAFSFAIMGKAVPAVGWLRSAVQLGVPDIQNVVGRREFDVIRDSDPFQKWLKSLK